MVSPDIYVSVKFYSSSENGRRLPTNSKTFGVIFVIGESKHDCRLLLSEIGPISPGETKSSVPIKFLCPDMVIPKIKVGMEFNLWDMREIASGTVEKIICPHEKP